MNLHSIQTKDTDILNYLTQRFPERRFWWEGETIRHISNEANAETVMTLQPSDLSGWVARSHKEWIDAGRPPL